MPEMELLIREDCDFGVHNWFADKALGEEVQRVIVEAFEESPPYAFMPVEWRGIGPLGDDGLGGPEVSDPLTIYVGIPVGSVVECPVHYRTSIPELIDELIDGHRNGAGGRIVDPAGKRIVADVAGALRREAARLETMVVAD